MQARKAKNLRLEVGNEGNRNFREKHLLKTLPKVQTNLFTYKNTMSRITYKDDSPRKPLTYLITYAQISLIKYSVPLRHHTVRINNKIKEDSIVNL